MNNLRNCDNTQQQVTVTTEPTASTILSGVGMSGGSITYTNLGMLNMFLLTMKQLNLNCSLFFFGGRSFIIIPPPPVTIELIRLLTRIMYRILNKEKRFRCI